jgi:hypothetical protein
MIVDQGTSSGSGMSSGPRFTLIERDGPVAIACGPLTIRLVDE